MEQKKDQEAVVTLEELEKSWNDSKTALTALLGEPDEPVKKSSEEKEDDKLDKAKKDKKDDAEEEDEDEEEEEEEEEEAEKSLETELSDDPEFAAAMDIEPFLRKFAKSMDKRFAALSETLASNSKINKTLAKALLEVGNQQMLIANTVEAIGNQPVTSRSILKKSGDRFEDKGKSGEGALEMDRNTVLDKSLKLVKEGKLTSRDISKIENRLNKGMELQPEYVKLLKEEK